LIKQGAKLVQDWNDVVEELSPEDRRALASRIEPQDSDPSDQGSLLPGPNQGIARSLLERLRVDNPTHLDDIMESMEEFSSSELIATLFELELAGLVRQLPGKNFVKVW
jgi:DNA processing protein